MAQHRFFLSKYQNEQQSIADFVAALRSEIIECEFMSPCSCNVSIANIFLSAQFIRGVHDNGIREQLLQSSTSKFEEIVAKALALEAAKVDAKELGGSSSISNVNTTADINKISKINKSKYASFLKSVEN